MARTREFDRDTVLLSAANLFRQRGYRNVSISDLEKSTGLVSGSIYNAFGDKARLFRAALAHYVDSFVRQRLNTFASATARLEDLEGLYLSVLEMPLADGHGCLVTNSIVEFGREAGVASEGLGEALELVRKGVACVIERELGAEAARSETTRLIVLYHGILVLSRSTTSFAEMADMVRAEFSRLRDLRDRAASA